MSIATMRAAVLDRFGGPDVLEVKTVPVPEIGPGQVLIRVEAAGVGEWDPFEREGGYAELLGMQPSFPYILGSEGAGTIAAAGERADRFRTGDRVYAPGFLNPKGGFYAEYVAVDADLVSPIPSGLSTAEAGVVSGVGITALRGLEDVLQVRGGESVLIFGASGGIGHLAVQIAKRMGARVFAVASGEDGVALAERLGADAVANGRSGDVLAAARAFAPAGFDAALLTAGGEAAEQTVQAVRSGGRIAWPNGIRPEPLPRPDLRRNGYNGEPEPEIIRRFSRLLDSGPLRVHIAEVFPLGKAVEAHRALERHYLGKIALSIG